jgi:hypothetical protein
VKWQTHCLQEAALARAWEFKSPLGHNINSNLIFIPLNGYKQRNHQWDFLFLPEESATTPA